MTLFPTIPVEDPITIFALAMIIFLVAQLLLERHRLPGIIGIILVGAAIGPNAAGIIERGDAIVLLGEVGLIYLMFLAGVEIDLNRFFDNIDQSIIFGVLAFLIPQGVGTVFGMWVFGFSLPTALLFAAIFASHTLLAYPVARQLGIVGNDAVTATIGGTVLTNVLALLVLVIVVASAEAPLDWLFWVELGLGIALLFTGIWYIVPWLGRRFFRSLAEESYFEFLFVMAALFGSAVFAEVVGAEPIIGALVAGLALNRLIPDRGPLMNRVQFVGNALFIPFFLLSIGLLVDVTAIVGGRESLLLAGALIGLTLVTKFVASWLTGLLYAYDHDQIGSMFGLSVGQAEALAIVLIAFDASVPGFDTDMINGAVLMILVVSLVSPIVVEKYGRAVVTKDRRGKRKPTDVRQRILIPFTPVPEHHEKLMRYHESLVDLALFIREEQSTEPLHTLAVVHPGPKTERKVATADAAIAHTEEYAAGAEVPVTFHTRVDHNIASGITRAAVENRITTILLDWDGMRLYRQPLFSQTTRQVLAWTDQLVLVSRIRAPLNTVSRIVFVLPPELSHDPNFYEVGQTIERIAAGTGAPIRALVVEESGGRYEQLFGKLKSNTPIERESIDDWEQLIRVLSEDVTADDLVVCASARRNTIGWRPVLQELTERVSTLTPGDFVVIYPPVGRGTDEQPQLSMEYKRSNYRNL
ncbi:cation:proton antiporter [Natronosalvus halobius]|uniref:cation:proton antiporter n=1 Tax=Natronosalvus halobius TaxID=2953746 RepID=UPI00209F9E35|nr:cation:proton antiporter [Natronosalvus halobius]USZ72265.1 cation:proton antiporter [Natronosalvus halobius]